MNQSLDNLVRKYKQVVIEYDYIQNHFYPSYDIIEEEHIVIFKLTSYHKKIVQIIRTHFIGKDKLYNQLVPRYIININKYKMYLNNVFYIFY
jgi:hypothetical protein